MLDIVHGACRLAQCSNRPQMALSAAGRCSATRDSRAQLDQTQLELALSAFSKSSSPTMANVLA